MQTVKRGYFYGTGSAINISLGFIPERVEVHNFTDGTPFIVGFPAHKVMAFTSGGTSEIKAGHKLIGATSGATATVIAVLADTGTWAGGDAAGNIIIDADTETGTFASESVYSEGSANTNDATGAATAQMGFDSDTEIAAFVGISAYLGTAAGNSKGFTVAAGSSTDAKMFIWEATREVGD